MTIVEKIKSAPLFQNVDIQTIEDIAHACKHRHLDKNQDLFYMGDDAHSFFLILNGWVKLYRLSREGEEVIIHIFGAGETFAEAAVFNEKKIYPVNAQAIEGTDILEIPRSFFTQRIEQNPSFALKMLGAIASRQHYLVQQLEQVTTRSAPQRIGTFLLRFSENDPARSSSIRIVRLPYGKAIISNRLNIKPETFSRSLSKLKPYGVELDGKTIILKDVEALASFCDFPTHERPC